MQAASPSTENATVTLPRRGRVASEAPENTANRKDQDEVKVLVTHLVVPCASRGSAGPPYAAPNAWTEVDRLAVPGVF